MSLKKKLKKKSDVSDAPKKKLNERKTKRNDADAKRSTENSSR
jgi:hypothetical protein